LIYTEEVRDRLYDPLATNFKFREPDLVRFGIGKPVPIPDSDPMVGAEEYKFKRMTTLHRNPIFEQFAPFSQDQHSSSQIFFVWTQCLMQFSLMRWHLMRCC
jgi:hypothetical protein